MPKAGEPRKKVVPIKKLSRWEALRFDLEAVVEEAGISVRYDAELRAQGGFCRVLKPARDNDGPVDLVIMNSRLSHEEKAGILAGALKDRNLEDVFLKPDIREFIETGKPPLFKSSKSKIS